MRDLLALHRYLAERANMPFEWGHDKNDCASFAAGAITAQTGEPFDLGGAWSTAAEAARVIADRGGMEAAVDALLDPVPAGMAKRGDLAMVAGEHRPLLMIVEGDMLVGPGELRAERLPRTLGLKFWSID